MDVKRFFRGSAAAGAAAFFGVAAVALIAATPLNDIPGTTEMYSAAETDARIAELGGAGDYATVSNAAVNAGLRATNYTDYAVIRLSQTNSVLSGGPYVTPSGMEDYVTNALSGIAADRITDGTNVIDAARNVYATSHNWQFTGQRDDDEISLTYGSDAWTMVVYSYSLGTDMSSIVTNENVTRLVFNFPDGDRAYSITAFRNVPTYVGRLALTNDIPSVVDADLTPATNYANQVARDSTNYTDAIALDFVEGRRTAHFSDNSVFAQIAVRLGDTDTSYTAQGLIRESTNAAIAVAASKQDALPYPTNAIPYAAISGTPSLSEYATHAQVAGAAVAATNYTDNAISTNNAAFVSAVLAVPLAGADAGDLAEIAEYGGYGTVGAALLALIAGLAALKRRMATAETAVSENATAVASVRADLPYALVTPGVWEFSDGGSHEISGPNEVFDSEETTLGWVYQSSYNDVTYYSQPFETEVLALATLEITFSRGDDSFTATRPSLPGHLLDRAGNRVVVSGDMTLTLPAAVPGYLRDFLVRLEISGSTVPTITFAAPTGETITYETDGDEFPVPDDAGDWLYSFTESCVAHKFAVSLKKVNTVAAPQAQGGS